MSQVIPDRPLQIRLATAHDVPVILELIKELATYEKEPEAVSATTTDLHRDGFGPVPRFHVFLADWLGVSVGFALYCYNYSTWEGHHGIHLEDLFVRPDHRGKGIGRALLTKVAAIAVVEGCPRLEWNVLDWNKSAIDFYHEMGAQISPDWRIMRLTGDALCRLSERCD